jgi:hypothetical protein
MLSIAVLFELRPFFDGRGAGGLSCVNGARDPRRNLPGMAQLPLALTRAVRSGDFMERGQPLFTLHAASPGELAYALEYASAQTDTVHVVEDA